MAKRTTRTATVFHRKQYAKPDFPVCFIPDTDVGRSRISRAIRNARRSFRSARKKRFFLPPCETIPPELCRQTKKQNASGGANDESHTRKTPPLTCRGDTTRVRTLFRPWTENRTGRRTDAVGGSEYRREKAVRRRWRSPGWTGRCRIRRWAR